MIKSLLCLIGTLADLFPQYLDPPCSMRLRRSPDNLHGTMSVANYVLRNAANQETTEARSPVRPKDDQVSMPILGSVDDLRLRIPFD
jgi:hypothetical protein